MIKDGARRALYQVLKLVMEEDPLNPISSLLSFQGRRLVDSYIDQTPESEIADTLRRVVNICSEVLSDPVRENESRGAYRNDGQREINISSTANTVLSGPASVNHRRKA